MYFYISSVAKLSIIWETNKIMDDFLFHPFHEGIELVVEVKHPVGEFGFGMLDEGIGHFLIVGVCHRTCDGCKGVGIASEGDGELEAVGIVFALEKTDDGNWNGELAGL